MASASISVSKSNISDVKPNGDAQKRSLKCAMNAGDMREEEAGAGVKHCAYQPLVCRCSLIGCVAPVLVSDWSELYETGRAMLAE